MASTTVKPPHKSSRRKRPQPVTSGPKPGTPGPSTAVNLNPPLDCGDLDAKSASSGPETALIDPTFQSSSSSSPGSGPQTGESETESILNVIGTPALPTRSPTPAPITQSKSTAMTSAATLPPIPVPPSPSATMSKNPEAAAPAHFGAGEEFIAFAFSDSDEDTAPVPIREWDQGKQDGDVEKRGKKRKSGEMSRDDREYNRDARRERGRDGERDMDRDRYGEKRQRMENVPRHAPWIANTDWDRCTNVAEL